MSTGYKIDNQAGAYFITLQIVNWADLFSRQVYRDIVINNLQYCIANKGLIVYAYVIMSNHMHLLVQSSNGQLSNTIRDLRAIQVKSSFNILSKIMKVVLSGYWVYLNKLLQSISAIVIIRFRHTKIML